jgi:cardiolipin synthase
MDPTKDEITPSMLTSDSNTTDGISSQSDADRSISTRGGLWDMDTHVLARATGSPEIPGNTVNLQFDGPSTFDTWIDAINAAERYVHFENYIIRNDKIGRIFRDVLIEKARQGIEVRVLYDWVGCWATSRGYWKPFRQADVEVRSFNRPSFQDPYGIFQRDHRKLVVVDGKVAFAGGFCVGQEWAGRSDYPPWRDTGLEIRGPAAVAAARAFERIWNVMGESIPSHYLEDQMIQTGDTSVWLIEGEPRRSRVMRTLSLVAAMAKERLWITDPYFVAPGIVAEAMTEAARAGVDVRLLVPANNNWPLVGSLSRAGYRYLLDHGVRLFEWKGPMIHAKSAVADGIWCRVGSSNLNAWSLLGNWEIDVGVMDTSLAEQLEALFLEDLGYSSEVILPGSRKSHTITQEDHSPEFKETTQTPLDPEKGFTKRLEALKETKQNTRQWHLAQFVRASASFGGALAGHRTLGREDRTILGTVSVIAITAAVAVGFFPKLFGWTTAFVLLWLGLVTGVRAISQRMSARHMVPEDKEIDD